MLKGIYLPIITPFKDGNVNFSDYEKLLKFYMQKNISGIIPLGTTGESPTISDYEFEKITEKTVEVVDGKLPIYIGLGGNNTNKLISKLDILKKYDINGILSACPYYNKPSQKGLYEHFFSISKSTDLDIILYNIPYRTGVNLENETVFKLAQLKNIIGIKDSCANINQTMELILNKPKDFSVLTGDDLLFYTSLCLGGDGAVLASVHLQTDDFASIYTDIKNNDINSARETWKKLSPSIPLLFKEPNPAPIKYILKQSKLIESAELRLPLTEISDDLKKIIDNTMI